MTNKYFIIAIIFVAAVIMYEHKADIYAQLNDWKLIPQSEHFTELYFNDHVNLPSQISKGQQVSFSFVIHDLEGRGTNYPYTVYFESQDGQITKIEDNSIELADGESRTINESYTAQSDNNSGKVVVGLTEKQQSIDFLLNNIQQ